MEAGASRNILTDQGERPVDLVDPGDARMISVMLSSLEKRRWIIIVKIIILSPPILPPIYPYHFWLYFPPSPKSCWENQNVKLYNFDYLTYILTPQFFVLLHDLNDCMRRFTKDKKVCAGQCCWNKKTLYSLKGCVILHSYLRHKWIVYTSILLWIYFKL